MKESRGTKGDESRRKSTPGIGKRKERENGGNGRDLSERGVREGKDRGSEKWRGTEMRKLESISSLGKRGIISGASRLAP